MQEIVGQMLAFYHQYPIVAFSIVLATYTGIASALFPEGFHNILTRMFEMLICEKRADRLAYEVSRKSFHLIGLAIVPVYDYFGAYSRQIALYLLIFAAATFVGDVIRMRVKWINDLIKKTPFLRPQEYDHLTGIPTFELGLASAFFFKSKISLYALLFGDTAAALVGISIGRTKICDKKTLEGFLGFVVAVIFCSRECEIPFVKSVILGVVGACCELYSVTIKFNDNFLIPFGVSIANYLMEVRKE